MTVIYQTKMCETEAVDQVDRLPSRDRVTKWDIAGFIISIISHLVDLIFDCNLAYRYYTDNQIQYFYITLVFILVPAMVNTCFSIRMYVLDREKHRNPSLPNRLTKRGFFCIFILLLQLAPVLRYVDALNYALKSKKAEKERDVENQRKYYKLMVQEDSDVALLRVLECFLEAAPQQILQLSIIFHTHGQGITNTLTFMHQLLSIGSSFASMAWSMASYQRLLRVSLNNKNNITWAGTIMQFMWHFLVTVSRIMCISVVASIYPEYTVIALVVHWAFMVIWLLISTHQLSFCNNNHIYELLFYMIFGTVFIFTHVSLNDGRTLWKYVFFYMTLCVENVVCTIIWMLKADAVLKSTLYYEPILYINFISFFIGILFMIVYYKIFHPSTGYLSRLRPNAVNS
ncbi:PREDICTED: XK-related protein 7 [Nicrophorus vespilloides]|uniref:XK-related protein n=1 Tax=Nicrophorus vespilloides TaxID=110193 RepID=A0ABM1MFQ4_NICVS|nr:PREDICTED: XK-related protein 7 [Nicrophorus vespilloides]